jgi:hypothetical protein
MALKAISGSLKSLNSNNPNHYQQSILRNQGSVDDEADRLISMMT